MTTIFDSTDFSECKTHKEKLTTLYNLLHENTYGYGGASIQPVEGQPDLLNIKLSGSQSDLKRFQDMNSTKQFLVNPKTSSVIKLTNAPTEEGNGSILAQTTEPTDFKTCVKFRKGTTNEKDIFVEVWQADQGFKTSLKITDKLKMVYNDSMFGGISWSTDKTKIVFIGEQPEIATYKPFFKDKEEPKTEEE